MQLITINEVPIKGLTKFEPYINDLDSDKTGRNALGNMIRDLVARIPKIECTTKPLNGSEMKQLLQLLKLTSFTVKWYDPEIADYRTGEFYCGEHSPSLLITNPLIYKPMDFNLIAYSGVKD